MTSTNYFVYLVVDPRNNQPFYIGAGSGRKSKRLGDHINEAKNNSSANTDKTDRINEILAEGLTPTLITHDCVDETHTATMEKQLIAQYGMMKDGGILTNRHPGGGGIKGAGRAGNKNGRLPPKAVYQFDLEGTLLKCWPAVTQAAKGVGVSHPAIVNAINGRNNTKSAGGFQWSYSDVSPGVLTINDKAKKSVYEQYDMDWNLIATYPTGVAAKKATGVDPSSIRLYLIGAISHAGGFYWKKSKGQ